MAVFQEFKSFIARGNVIDMAVGIIIGAAFTSIVSSLVADLLNPVLGLLSGGMDFSNQFITLKGESYATLAEAKKAGSVTLNYGHFINQVINFLIVAFVIFMMVKQVNKLRAAPPKEGEKTAPPPRQEQLLEEIRDLLTQKA